MLEGGVGSCLVARDGDPGISFGCWRLCWSRKRGTHEGQEDAQDAVMRRGSFIGLVESC